MPPLQLVENPDILATISKLTAGRPATGDRLCRGNRASDRQCKAKLARKGCDWIVANDVSPATGVMGGDRNTVHLLRGTARNQYQWNSWPAMTKEEVAAELVARIAKDCEGEAIMTPS